MNTYLKILSHPIFNNLGFHMPMVVDLSHPLVLLTGENGCGKSTLLHSMYYAFRGEDIPHYVYKTKIPEIEGQKVVLFDAEQHNPRNNLDDLGVDEQAREFFETASHGQVMLHLFQETFPSLPDGTVLLLDEPEMALSVSNQRRILKMLKELVDDKNMRIVAATHSPVLIDNPETYVIDLDKHINRNELRTDMAVPGQSQIH
ncbi:MAG TPA: AAA family ATPase [Acidobacteriota bacterium]|nr:AAA family ATPase [Acidobacteriota bacterium]